MKKTQVALAALALVAHLRVVVHQMSQVQECSENAI